jgi:hypothetical protein
MSSRCASWSASPGGDLDRHRFSVQRSYRGELGVLIENSGDGGQVDVEGP